MEVSVQQLQQYYAEHRYTVTQVVQWHLARVHRYDGIYRAIETRLSGRRSRRRPEKMRMAAAAGPTARRCGAYPS